MDRYIKKIVTWGSILALAPALAWAIPIPSIISPERQTPFNPPPDGGIRPPSPVVEDENKPSPQLDESALKVKFTLKKIILEGNKTFTYEQLSPVFKDSLGKEISLADLQNMADQIEKYYVERGYILTRVIIPPQEIDSSGVVKLQVIEGYVSNVVIEGQTKKVKKLIEAFVEPVLDSQPLQIAVMERAVLLINDIPGVETKAVLTPSMDTPGASTLVLVVDQAFFDGAVFADNRGTKFVGPTQFSTVLSFNNILQDPGQLQFDGKVTSDTNELRSGNLQYMAEVFQNGSTLTGAYTMNRVLPGNDLAPLEINGTSNTASLVYYYPFIRLRRMNLSGTAIYDYLNSKTYITDILVTLDRIESVRIGGSFDVVDNWQGINLITAQYSQGIQFLSGNEQPEILRSRVDGQKNYSKVNVSYTRLQSLPQTWSLFFSTTGQLAFNSLLSAEQLGYGGVQYGSAYDSSEIIGDSGVEGKIELRYNSPTPGQFFRSTQYFASYDGAVLYDKHDIDNQGKQSGTSVAAGIRLDILDRVNASLEMAKPLTRKVAAYDDKAIRFFFGVTVDLGS